VLDGHHVNTAAAVIDAVDHPVFAAEDTVQTLKPELERLAHPARAGRQRPIQKFH
jgi:hypothetical protein